MSRNENDWQRQEEATVGAMQSPPTGNKRMTNISRTAKIQKLSVALYVCHFFSPGGPSQT